MLTLDMVKEIVKPHNDKLLAEIEADRYRCALQRILDFKPDDGSAYPDTQIAAFAKSTAETVLQPRR